MLNARAGDANIKRTVVAMPKDLILDNSHIKTVCTRVQFAAGSCPSGSEVGQAMVTTPLLDAPLSGPVYLRSSNHSLPDLVVALKGQFDIELVGQVGSTKAGGLRTVFDSVPDAPVSRFELNLYGKAERPASKHRKPLQGRPKGSGPDGRTERQGTQQQYQAAVQCGSAKQKRKRAARHSRRDR